MQQPPLQIAPASPEEHRAAIELALRPLPATSRATLLDSIGLAENHPLGPLSALLVARDSQGQIAAATWAQPSPGRSAALWSPEWRQSREADALAVEASLVASAMRVADAAGVGLTQALFEDPRDPRIPAVESAGFAWMARLEYMSRVIMGSQKPAESHGCEGVEYEPYDDSKRNRLKRVLQATYVNTLDCPGLDGQRDLDDVLAGYQATGQYREENWLFVTQSGTDIGALLMAEHPSTDQLELVYMGLDPAQRGKGLGKSMVSKVLARAAEVSAEQVVVAVDAANKPARDAYTQLGFSPWTERTVYVRKKDQIAG